MVYALSTSTQPPAQMSGAETDAAAISLWLKAASSRGSARSQHTIDSYRRTAATLPQKPLNAITLTDLLDWQTAQTGKPSSVAVRTAHVKSLFSFLNEVGYLHLNVAKLLPRPQVADERHQRTPSKDEVHAVLEVCRTPRERALVSVLYSSGARISEVLGLTWLDVQPLDDGRCVLHLQGKGGKKRAVTISATAYNLLAAQRTDAEYCFATRTGRQWTREQAARSVKAIVGRLSSDHIHHISPHSFRHGHASHSLAAGATVADVSAQLGHSDVKVTSVYLQPSSPSSAFLDI